MKKEDYMNMMEQVKYVYFLMQVSKLGNTRIKNILNRLPQSYDFFNCSQSDLRKIEGIDHNISAQIIESRKNRNTIEAQAEEFIGDAEKRKINIVSVMDDRYPENLKKIFDAPVLLYCKGKLDSTDKYSLSIVGTRNPTEYGKYSCEKFTEKLCELGIPVISGFARGIDSIVHNVCLKNDNLTYAVFGCGADIIYPSENRKLYFELIERGAVISEFPIGSKPEKVNFPRRNRIISGISLGSLIIESGIKGGSLLTAEFAIDQDKEVFAVPGYINSKQSEGTNDLIKRGHAKLVTNIDDILEELEVKLKPVLKKDAAAKEEKLVEGLNESEKIIFVSLNYEPVHIDSINETTGLSISDCLVNLLSLEFKGLVRQTPGKNFMKI
ncbi:MAG: DNA-protecting protein DprA [Ignavibacteria bacterium]|nr:DNA-protecting protein DprA [Ignavibacteria bacterium]